MSAPAPDRETALASFSAAFAARRYFEAHEILEAYWVAYHGQDREFYRGLIQAAVALHHVGTGNAKGASGVAARARGNLAPFAAGHAGIDVASVLALLAAEIP